MQAEIPEIAQPVADPSGTAVAAVSEPKDPLLIAVEAQQEAVTADPGDFNKWVSLIGAAEKLVRPSSGHQLSFKFLSSFMRHKFCVLSLLCDPARVPTVTYMQGL